MVYLYYLKILEKPLTHFMILSYKENWLNLELPIVSKLGKGNSTIVRISDSIWLQNLLSRIILLKYVSWLPF